MSFYSPIQGLYQVDQLKKVSPVEFKDEEVYIVLGVSGEWLGSNRVSVSLLSDIICVYPPRPVHSWCTYCMYVDRHLCDVLLWYILPSASRHNRLPPLVAKYRRVQPPVASISAGQTRSLRPENCIALSISIRLGFYSACDVTQLPVASAAAAAAQVSVTCRPAISLSLCPSCKDAAAATKLTCHADRYSIP